MSDGLVLQRIAIAEIEVGKRRRPVDCQALEALKADIEARGLRTPIEVFAREEGGWTLIAGLHRLTAVRELGHGEIDVIVSNDDGSPRKHELLENLSRVELTALERCQFLAELKEIFQEETGARHGGDRRSPNAINGPTVASWYRSVALRAGRSPRTIKLQASIGVSLDDTAAEKLRGTAFEDNQRELEALSRLEPRKQQRVALLLTTEDDDARAASVAEALAKIDGEIEAAAAKTTSSRMWNLWNRASADERRAFVAELSEDELADAIAARGYRLERI